MVFNLISGKHVKETIENDHPHPNPLPSRERSFSKAANDGRTDTQDLLPLDC